MGKVKILNDNIDVIDWQNRTECGFVLSGQADVWRINISTNTELSDNFRALLTPSELNRANRYFQLKDKNRFIISRAALRIILGHYLTLEPTGLLFGTGENEKPYISNPGIVKLNYNLSHSGDWILLAVSQENVGIDVELVDKTFNYNGIINDFFADNEITYIEERSSISRFYQIWTRKEALTKGTGKGLDEDMKYIPGLNGEHKVDITMIGSMDDWSVSSFAINTDHAASIAVHKTITSLRFFHFSF